MISRAPTHHTKQHTSSIGRSFSTPWRGRLVPHSCDSSHASDSSEPRALARAALRFSYVIPSGIMPMIRRSSCDIAFSAITKLTTIIAITTLIILASQQRCLAEKDQSDNNTAVNLTAAILPIHGEITDVTVESLKRRIEEAKKKQADVIVFDMDTPGGLVTSSIAIADLIRDLTEIKTVAWVHPNAHSGGSIVAVSCDEIVMSRSSRMGDSQVIMGGPGGVAAVPEELRAKAYTPVLSDFRTSARLNGYSQVLAEAFVVPEKEVWWIENIETGEKKFVFANDKNKLVGDDDDDDFATPTKTESAPSDADTAAAADNKTADGQATGDQAASTEKINESKDKGSKPASSRSKQWKLVETYFDPLLDMEVDTIQPVVRDDQLLEMSSGEAYAYGFSKAVIVNEDALKARFGIEELVRLVPSWTETLTFWLTSIYVRGFLMLIILLGAYVEFHTPGVGVPGLVSLICLGIFVGAPYLTGLANAWEVLLIVVGVGLLALEVFVIPGFGLAGISGIILMIAGLLATFIPEEPGRMFPLYFPELPETMQALKNAVVTLVTSFFASLLGIAVLGRYLPQMPLFRRIVPANPTPSQVLPDDPYRGLGRVGDIGQTEGPLRPSGKVRFSGMLIDVVTQGEFIDAHAKVEVIERRGSHTVVRSLS